MRVGRGAREGEIGQTDRKGDDNGNKGRWTELCTMRRAHYIIREADGYEEGRQADDEFLFLNLGPFRN